MSVGQSVAITAQALLSRISASLSSTAAFASRLLILGNNADPNKVFENGTFKSTTVALGSNPAVGSKPQLTPPTITTGEMGADGIGNPYNTINFQIDQQTVDGNQIVSFRVYRQVVPAENLAQEVEQFAAADFERIGGNVDPSLTSPINQNVNLYTLQATTQQQDLGNTQDSFPDYFGQAKATTTVGPQLVATINNAAYQASASLKQVYVQTDNLVNLSYTDNNVTWGTGYVYTVTSFCETSQESAPSENISMVVLNLKGIDPPTNVTVKQSNTNGAVINISVNPDDHIKNVYIFRRNTEDLVFHPFGVLNNVNNYVTANDNDIAYLNSYVYRVLLENVWGAISEPTEVNFTCSQQNVIGSTRSNNLQLPILLASQDQSSQGIKLTIFPNDQRILYYTLERRNVTAGETVFSTPTNGVNQFWPLNQFFVQRSSGSASGSIVTSGTLSQIASGSLPAQSQFIDFADPITFVDNIVTADNYYEYRTVGYDLFGNVTGYGFAALKALNKNALRSPVNFIAETLRETPFRVKLTWQDDNEASQADQANTAQQTVLSLALQQANLSQQQQQTIDGLLNGQNLATADLNSVLGPYNIQQAQITAVQNQLQALGNANNVVKYQLQRRLSGDTVYSSFPLTQNAWVVDEVACTDAVPFTTGLASGSPGPSSSSLTPITASLSRSYGVPDFMQAQQVYQYRVAVQTLDGNMSDFSAPLTVVASAQISQPAAFSASILNPRVTPVVVKLEWEIDPLKNTPDHYRIERQVNVATDTYRVIGNSYLSNEYFDRSAQSGVQYLYRIRSVSAAGDESDTQTTTVNT